MNFLISGRYQIKKQMRSRRLRFVLRLLQQKPVGRIFSTLQTVFAIIVIIIQTCIIVYLIDERNYEIYESVITSNNDLLQYINNQNKSSRTIIVITPTYLRFARLADMTRLSQTLMHINQLIWIVVEDAAHISIPVKHLLDRTGLQCYYLAAKRRSGIPARGWTGRDVGLNFVRKRFASLGSNAVVYFADDDNTYDIRLFNRYIRNVEKVGVWAVGLVAHNMVEAPKVINRKVVGWQTVYAPKRKWGFDMAGFAINLELLLQHPQAGWRRKCREQSPEPCLMNYLNVSLNDLTPFGVELWSRDILVWHTRTAVHIRSINTYGYNAEVPFKPSIVESALKEKIKWKENKENVKKM
ncbi:Galactosylgalactosylxylosylprotein 3-beta-glucuronosyltransferase [Dirofilaria immitis]